MFKKYLLLVFLTLTGVAVLAQTYPEKSTTLVTDYTNTLSADNKAQLENKLVAFDDSTSTQIAVVIIKSVGQYDIAQYGAGLGRTWGIGQKGKNNGVLILVALDDHKVTIQTGYGSESGVPDVIANQIINNDITPAFKQGNYFGGLDAATSSLIQYMSGQYKADNKPQTQAGNQGQMQQTDDNGDGGSIGILIVIVIVIVILIFRNIGRGGGGQIIGGRGGASPFWWFLMGSAMGGGFGGGNNNDSGGSSGGGSDSGGGDFGGFGGGDFGGGGSSGSW